MKAKTINLILSGKFHAFLKSITDPAVAELVKNNSIITGGSIVSLLTNQEVSDFDLYFRNAETALAVAKYYVAELSKNPPAKFKSDEKHTVSIYAMLEAAIAEGQEASRIGGMMKGPLPARVRIVVKSAGIQSGETQQKDYQYFEGIRDDASQAAATDKYVTEAMGQEIPTEGQITDDTEPKTLPEAYQHQVEELDDHSSEKLNDDEVTQEEVNAVADHEGLKPEKKKGEGSKPPYRVLFVTSNAITLSDKMQLILRFQGEPEEIHKNYDFVHCTNYWTSWDKKLTLRPEALEAILTKELRYIGSKYPICSLIRVRKFIARGWTINAGQFVKMAYQVSKLDLDDANVLEDQLVGVDSAYFSQVIEQLKKKTDESGGAKLDGTYLMTLIDKIF